MNTFQRNKQGSGNPLSERLSLIGQKPTRMVLVDIFKEGKPWDTTNIEAVATLTLEQLQDDLAESFGEDRTIRLSETDVSPDEVPADIRVSFPLILEKRIIWH